MENLKQTVALCQSKGSDSIVKFLKVEDLTLKVQSLFNEGELWGVYYSENEIIAEDNEGNIYRNILN